MKKDPEEDSIVITVDTEWSPDPVLTNIVSLLDQYDVSATLFSTHDDTVTTDGHERGLHPNFFKDKSEDEVLRDIATDFPEAIGLRSHGMYIHSALRSAYPEFDIQYESNYMQYLVEDLQPFWLLDEVIQFPVYFMDDFWLRSRESRRTLPDVGSLLDTPGMKVFDFHPIHVFLNTPTIGYYQQNKKYYDQPERLREERTSGPGVRELFINILEYIEKHDTQTKTLGDIARSFARRRPYEEIER